MEIEAFHRRLRRLLILGIGAVTKNLKKTDTAMADTPLDPLAAGHETGPPAPRIDRQRAQLIARQLRAYQRVQRAGARLDHGRARLLHQLERELKRIGGEARRTQGARDRVAAQRARFQGRLVREHGRIEAARERQEKSRRRFQSYIHRISPLEQQGYDTEDLR